MFSQRETYKKLKVGEVALSNNLTPRQKRFADEYLIDLNATRAYKVAYPNVKKEETASANGSRLLRNAKVENYLKVQMKDREQRTEITQDWALERLKTVAERCLTEIPVFDREGNRTGKWRFEHAGSNKALGLLGKHLDMFEDRISLEGSIGVQIIDDIVVDKDEEG